MQNSFKKEKKKKWEGGKKEKVEKSRQIKASFM